MSDLTDRFNFIEKIYPFVVKISEETGLSVELMLAQAVLETGWGKDVPEGSNNVYGIKADPSWTGPYVLSKTREG